MFSGGNAKCSQVGGQRTTSRKENKKQNNPPPNGIEMTESSRMRAQSFNLIRCHRQSVPQFSPSVILLYLLCTILRFCSCMASLGRSRRRSGGCPLPRAADRPPPLLLHFIPSTVKSAPIFTLGHHVCTLYWRCRVYYCSSSNLVL